MDLIGKTDPFVVFRAKQESKQTSIAKETQNYDYLTEQYDIIFDPIKMEYQREISIEVWDYDSFGKNDFIGSVNVDIMPSYNNLQQYDLFLQPHNENKDDQKQTISKGIQQNQDQQLGKVMFSMIYFDDETWLQQFKQKFKQEQNRKKKEMEPIQKQRFEQIKNEILEERRLEEEERIFQEEQKRRKEEYELKYVKGVVRFSNISVRNLPKMDLIGKTDPFVVFRAKQESKQTSIAKETQNYDYLTEQYEIIFDPIKMEYQREISIEVWDYDSFGKNDFIGSVNVDV